MINCKSSVLKPTPYAREQPHTSDMQLLASLLLLNFIPQHFCAKKPCKPRRYIEADLNIVCVCSATYCDEIEPLGDLPKLQAAVYTSSLSGKRFDKTLEHFAAKSSSSHVITITVDTRNQFQSIIGFGGAFTDSAGINIAALQDETQQNLLEAYFGTNGINYNIGRVPIASTDFSTREYSYDDVKGDFGLKKFKLEREDIEYKIPFIHRAMNLTSGNLLLFASPWSAPGWMKTTGRMKGGGALKEGEKFHQLYANYFVKFFEEYAKNGVPFWGLTIQNEPTSGAFPTYPWQTMLFTAKTQRDFVRNFLGPTLKRSNITKNLKVMALDDGRIMLPGWADIMFKDGEVSKYVDGIAVHWYGNNYTPASVLTTTHDRHPEKFILATEACTGYSMQHGPILGDWYRAERYASDIITDLNNFVTGWTDWNLCLDETGGPNWVFNVVDSPIIVNKTGDEFYKQPMFYAMGHFSKFLLRGAVRVRSKVTGTPLIEATAVIHNGRRSLVLLNRLSEETPIAITDVVMNRSLSLIISPHSIITFVWDKG